MTIVHRLDRPSEHAPARPRRFEAPPPDPVACPRDLGPKRAPSSFKSRQEARAETCVQFTLFVVVFALCWFALSVPRPRTTRAVLEAERAFVELRLTLSELRAVIADYRADHGVYPGASGDDLRDPHWFEREWQRAIERTSGPDAGEDQPRLPDPYDLGGIPPNPINAQASVRLLSPHEAWPGAADGSTGWVYQPATGEIRANCLGKAFGSQIPYWDL